MPSNLLDMSALTAFPMILANADQGSILMGAICTSVMRIRSSPPPLTKSSWIFKAYSSCREIGPVVLTVALCFKRYIGSFSFLKNNPHRPVRTRGDIGNAVKCYSFIAYTKTCGNRQFALLCPGKPVGSRLFQDLDSPDVWGVDLTETAAP